VRNVSSLSWLRRSAVNISSSSEYLPARIRFIALRLIAAASGPDCDSNRAAVISAVPTILGQCRRLFRLEAAGLLDGATFAETSWNGTNRKQQVRANMIHGTSGTFRPCTLAYAERYY
jgi:hypothetical protein